MSIQEIYQSLKGTRVKNGELSISDFSDENYEDLYYYLIEELSPYMDGNYEYFYMSWAKRYYKEKKRQAHKYEFYCPQVEKDVSSQTIREQLATLKYFIQRRAVSRYPAKVEKGE